MNSLTKAITIALTTAALSSSASANWWTGWNNNDTKVTPKTVVNDAEIVEMTKAIEKHSEITDVKTETVTTKTSSNNWWTGWNNSDTKSAEKSVESAEVSNTDEAQHEAAEVKAKEVAASTKTSVKSTSGNWWTGWNNNDTNSEAQTDAPDVKKVAANTNSATANNAVVKNTSGNWWTGWNNKNTKVADKTESADTTNTEAPEVAVKKVADNTNTTVQSASANWWTGWNNSDTTNGNSWWSGYNKTAPQGNTGYTGTGTTDIKTAALFKQLMKNNPNIEVTVVQTPTKANSQKKASESVTYTISGKTDRASVAKLVAQIKNNNNFEIIPNNAQGQAMHQRMHQQARGYYYYQQPIFIQSVSNPYIWYRAPMLVQPQQK